MGINSCRLSSCLLEIQTINRIAGSIKKKPTVRRGRGKHCTLVQTLGDIYGIIAIKRSIVRIIKSSRIELIDETSGIVFRQSIGIHTGPGRSILITGSQIQDFLVFRQFIGIYSRHISIPDRYSLDQIRIFLAFTKIQGIVFLYTQPVTRIIIESETMSCFIVQQRIITDFRSKRDIYLSFQISSRLINFPGTGRLIKHAAGQQQSTGSAITICQSDMLKIKTILS